MRQLLPIIPVLSLLISCQTTNLLNYKYRRYFSEESSYSDNGTKELTQQICYDKPRLMDGSFCYTFDITIKDTLEALRRKTLNLKRDTAIIACEYGILSVWFWEIGESGESKIFGDIEILRWEKNKIKLREDITIFDLRLNETKRLKGKRTFRKRY